MRIFLALVAHLFFTSIQAEIPAVLFKDITKQFKDPHYSPLMGRVALDSGLIYNYRMYGNFIPAYKKDEPEKRVFVSDAPQDAPMDLLLQLFPSSAGELASSSTAKSNFGKSATIDDVVNMLKYANAVRNIMKDNPNATLDNINTLDKKIKSVKLRAYIRDSILYEYEKIVLTPSDSSTEDSRSTSPSSSSDEGSSTPTSSGKSTLTKRSQIPQSPTLQAIEGDVLYPKFTTEQIILAFFVFQFNTQNDLDELIKGMGEFLGNVPSTDSTDLDHIFFNTYHDVKAPLPYKEGNPISNGSCPYIITNADGEKVFDPEKIDQKKQWNDSTKLKKNFPDCQETALREFMNIILYDKESNTFKLPEGIQNKHLIDFYAKQKPISANDGSPFIRGAWNLVVGGIPDVVYNKENGNEVYTGFINAIKVLRHVLGIDMPLPNDEKGVAGALEYIIRYLNPTFKDVQITINDFSTGTTRFGEDFFGIAQIQITNKEKQTFSFELYQSTVHGAIHNIKYKTTVPTLSSQNRNEDPLLNLIDKRNSKKGLYILFANGTLMDDNQKLDLLKRVITEMKGSYVPLIERVISSLSVRDNNNTRRLIDVYAGIVSKGFMYETALNAASQGMTSMSSDVRRSALEFFQALFKKGQGYDDAIEVASAGIMSTVEYVRRSALDLYKALFENGQRGMKLLLN